MCASRLRSGGVAEAALTFTAGSETEFQTGCLASLGRQGDRQDDGTGRQPKAGNSLLHQTWSGTLDTLAA
ncbi:hypothetical protein BMS3Abin02_02431 [bacterium BMS3Abin02]|nr:hypothetical protein BMS3Abin02_02431 [bacterium BMS3Abin02]GBE20824.1 hypothetical protein BMS3Bbin01_00165 [bacterium BMS3Bbin01]